MKKILLLAGMLCFAPLALAQDPQVLDTDSMEWTVDSVEPSWGNPRFACYASDRRGHWYRAVGRQPYRVQDRALDKCYRRSNFCRPEGCQRI